MNARHLASLLIFALPSLAHSQDQPEDDSGANSTLRFGFYTEASGQVRPARYEFIDDGENLRVSLALYGKTPVDLPVLVYDRAAGTLELGWSGHPDRRCRLDRAGENHFLGNCVEGEQVMPIAIREGNRFDAELMGQYLEVSETDIEILDRAARMLTDQPRRNVNDDRDCEGDAASGSVSVFCALYLASIEVSGIYRHRRPAIMAARMALFNLAPGDYEHLLRDINNNASIADGAFIEALESAQASLQARLGQDQ